jgi:hypothetical protein
VTGGSEIPAGSVVITPQNMWESINRIETVVNEIKITLAPAVKDLRDDHDVLAGVVEANRKAAAEDLATVKNDHEQRLRDVEKANWKQAGIYAAITVIATIGEAIYYTTHH